MFLKEARKIQEDTERKMEKMLAFWTLYFRDSFSYALMYEGVGSFLFSGWKKTVKEKNRNVVK